MIKISKVRLKNFKSFKAAELPFADGFTAIAGSNGSGKCVVGSTLVQLADGQYRRINDLVENALKENEIQELDDGIFALGGSENIHVLSLNLETLKIEKKPVKAFVRRESTKKLVVVKTRSGREITSTPYHPLFSIKNGKIVALKAEELESGIPVAVPRKLLKDENSEIFEELLGSFTEKDNIYAPFLERYKLVLKEFLECKKISLKEAGKLCSVPYSSLKGLMDRQSIKIAYLVKMFREAGYSTEKIIEFIPNAKSKTGSKITRIPWKNSPEFARFFGYFIAEGTNTIKNQVRMTTADREIIDDVKNISLKVFGISPFVKNYRQNATDIIIFSNPLSIILEKFGFKKEKTREKEVCHFFVKHSTEEELCEFLNGYYCGDGYISDKSIEAVSASEKLAKNIATMLLLLEIRPGISKIKKSCKNFSGIYWQINIFGYENMSKFHSKIRLTLENKEKKLETICLEQKRPNPNVDLIPEINGLIKETCKELNVMPTRKINPYPKLGAYTLNKCHASRSGLVEVLQKELITKEAFSENLEILKKLSNSDIFWDEIIEVQNIKSNVEFVYDLCIEQNHNFIANNIFIHNSNIFDAILFGLGITSMKLLRASRLSDLVNNTAAENYGKVDIVLRDGDKSYEISRMIDKLGRSVFKLNDEKKTLDEITSLLEELGIKPTGHNFVVQGDVTKIIEMSPEERRKIIDDIAGLKEFDEKKAEALNELDKVDSRIKEAAIVLKEREKYLEGLEKDKKAAMEYDLLITEKKQSKATILSNEILKINSEIEKLDLKKQEFEKERNEKEFKVQEILKEQLVLKEKISELELKLLQSSEQMYAGTGIQIENKKTGKEVLLEKINAKKDFLDRNNAKINSLKQKHKQLQDELEKSEKEFSELKEKLPESEKKLESLKKQKIELENLLNEKKSRESHFKEALDSVKNALNEEKEKYYSKNAQISEARKSNDFRREMLNGILLEKSHIEKRLAEQKEKDKALKELLGKNPSPEMELEEIEKAKEKALDEFKELHAMAKTFHEAIIELKKDIASCPVCDHPLNVKKKTELLAKKESALSELKKKMMETGQKNSNLDEKRLNLKKILETKRELEKHLHNFDEILQKDIELEKKIHGLKDSVNIDIEKQKKELHELEKNVEELEAKAEKLESEIAENSENAVLRKIGGISTEISSLELEKGLFAEKNHNRNSYFEKNIQSIREIEADVSILLRENHAIEKEFLEQEEKIKRFEKEIMDLEIEMHKSEKAMKKLAEEKNALNEKTNSLTEKSIQMQQNIKSLEQQENLENIEKSKLEVRRTDLKEEFAEFEGVQLFIEFEPKNLQKRIIEIERKILELGAINMKALEAYGSLSAEVNELKGKCQKLEEERLAVLEMIQKIEIKRTNVFMECFSQINKNFNKMFYYLFEGEGLLSLSNAENPLESGLLIEAKHKAGEKMKNIDAMSGGEKSLTALAFIFAMQMFEPSPFYVFDEADAALDQTNTEKLSNLIKEISRQSQFIAITHNSLLIKKADQLIGVALNEQKSSVIGLKLNE